MSHVHYIPINCSPKCVVMWLGGYYWNRNPNMHGLIMHRIATFCYAWKLLVELFSVPDPTQPSSTWRSTHAISLTFMYHLYVCMHAVKHFSILFTVNICIEWVKLFWRERKGKSPFLPHFPWKETTRYEDTMLNKSCSRMESQGIGSLHRQSKGASPFASPRRGKTRQGL